MTAARQTHFLSISGAPVEGRKLVRITYLDESGINKRDPITVVSGVIVHFDNQLHLIEEFLGSLIEKHIPSKHRPGFFFHASDIFSGGNKKCLFHNKIEWPDERRWAILDDLVSAPAKLELSVCGGTASRSYIDEQLPLASPNEKLIARHALAMMNCECAVDSWMKKNTEGEYTLLTAENNNDVRDMAKYAHNVFRDKSEMHRAGLTAMHPHLPLVKIKDGLQFARKEDCKALQVADVCAWAYRRYLASAPDAERFFGPMWDRFGPIVGI